MMRHTLLAISAVLIVMLPASLPARATPEKLVCVGRTHMTGYAPTDESVIEIDDATRSVAVDSGRYLSVPDIEVTRYDDTEVDFGVPFERPNHGYLGESEYNVDAMINRVSAAFSFQAHWIDASRGGHVVDYSGTCTKAEQKF